MTALRNAHRYTLCRLIGAGEADVTQHDDVDVAAPSGFCQKRDLVAHRIGEYRLKDETLPTPDQYPSQGICQTSRLVRLDREFGGQHIGVHESQPGRGQVRAEECRLPGSIRTGNRHKDWPPIKLGELHQGHGAAWNSRPTNRPTVRVPSTSTRTTSPGRATASLFPSFLRFSIVTNYCTCRLYLLVMTKATANIVKRCDDVPQKLRFSPNAGFAICPSSPILMRWPCQPRRAGNWLIVGKRPRLEVFHDTPASRSRINRGQTLGQRDYRAGPP